MQKLSINTKDQKHIDEEVALLLLNNTVDEKLVLFSQLSPENRRLWLKKDSVLSGVQLLCKKLRNYLDD